MFSRLKNWIKPGAESAVQEDAVDDTPTNTKKRNYHALNESENEQDEPASNTPASPPISTHDAVMIEEEESSADELDLRYSQKQPIATSKAVSESQRPAKRARSTSPHSDTSEGSRTQSPQILRLQHAAVLGAATPYADVDEDEIDSESDDGMDIVDRSAWPMSSTGKFVPASTSQRPQPSPKGKERAVSEELEEEPARPTSAAKAMARRTGAKASTTSTPLSMSTSSSGKAVLSKKPDSEKGDTGSARQPKPPARQTRSPSPVLVQASLPSRPIQTQPKPKPMPPKPPATSARPLSSAGSAIASTSKLPITSTAASSVLPLPAGPTRYTAENPGFTQPWPPEAKYTSLSQLNNYTTKPPYPYWVLGRAYILGTPQKKATLQDLAEAIVAKYPYYEEAKKSGALVKSLRAAFIGKLCFVLHKDSDKKVWYTIDESVNPTLNKQSSQSGRKSDASILPSAGLAASTSSSINSAAAVKNQVAASISKPKPTTEEDLVSKFIKNLLANPPALSALPPSEQQVFATSLTSLPTAEELFQSNLLSMTNTGASSISAAMMQRDKNGSDMGKLQKVPFPLFTLARAAILGSPHRKLRLEALLKAILERYPQLSNPEKEGTFRRLLTQTLQKHKCFYRASENGSHYQCHWMVDLSIDPRLVRHEPTANMNRKEVTQYREAFSTVCKDLSDVEKTSLDTVIDEFETHAAYYARSQERANGRKDSLALSMLGPAQPLPRLPTPPPPPKQRTPSPELAEEPPRPRTSPTKSASRPNVRLPSPEIPIPPPSPARQGAGTMSIKGKAAALSVSQQPKPPPRAAGTSSPEPMAFSGASSRRTSSIERTDSRDSRAAAVSSRNDASQNVIILSGDSDSDEDDNTTILAPPSSPAKLPYICGFTDHKKVLMCEERFGHEDELAQHRRYAHGQVQPQYLVPRIPKAALAALPKTTMKKKKKAAVRKAQVVKPVVAVSMARKQPAVARQPKNRQQSVEV